MTLLNLIVEDARTINNYKKLFQSKNYNLSKEIILDGKSDKVSADLVVVDIKNNKSFDLLENLVFRDDSFVIIISPLSQRFIRTPDSLKKANVFYITKPIDILKFEIILKDCDQQIKKSIYLKTKETILVKSVDESPLIMGVYDFNGYLLYANEPYTNTYNIDNIENTRFQDLEYDIEFADVNNH